MPGRPTEKQKRKEEKENENDKTVYQIIFLDTKPFVIFTDELFQGMSIFKKWFNRFFL